MKRFHTPGPGSYRTPSDFGYVDVVQSSDKSKRNDEYNQYGYPFNESFMSKRGTLKDSSRNSDYDTLQTEYGLGRNRFGKIKLNRTLAADSRTNSVTPQIGQRIKSTSQMINLLNNCVRQPKQGRKNKNRSIYSTL